jgi:ferredoxin
VLVAEVTTAPVRPPGSVPEEEFLQLCIRCAECFKACPNNVLQPIGFNHGFDALWTPQVVADWAGCEPTCNNCGQVCPTGAIRALSPAEKGAARIALAVVNERTCLPYEGREDCRMCVDECTAAGYNAIEFVRIGAEIDQDGVPIEGSGYLAPVVLTDRCVGCGLCQMRCHSINVKNKKLLQQTAIRILAGPGREDRIMKGSYLALQKERTKKQTDSHLPQRQNGPSDDYLPDFLK